MYYQSYKSYLQVLSDVGGLYCLIISFFGFFLAGAYDTSMLVKIANSFYHFDKGTKKGKGEAMAKKQEQDEQSPMVKKQEPQDLFEDKDNAKLVAHLGQLIVESY